MIRADAGTASASLLLQTASVQSTPSTEIDRVLSNAAALRGPAPLSIWATREIAFWAPRPVPSSSTVTSMPRSSGTAPVAATATSSKSAIVAATHPTGTFGGPRTSVPGA